MQVAFLKEDRLFPIPLLCEVRAPKPALAGALTEIARIVGKDLGQPLDIECAPLPKEAKHALITLHLPVSLASSHSHIWCLACRLACFCTDARVSVLIRAEEVFLPPTPSAPSLLATGSQA